jgi:hypothetical protein
MKAMRVLFGIVLGLMCSLTIIVLLSQQSGARVFIYQGF